MLLILLGTKLKENICKCKTRKITLKNRYKGYMIKSSSSQMIDNNSYGNSYWELNYKYHVNLLVIGNAAMFQGQQKSQ